MTRATALPSSNATAVEESDGLLEPLLLAPDEIEFELRRLVKQLIAGSRLLWRIRAGGDDPDADHELLLDVEVDGVRCVLTARKHPGASHVNRLTVREREIAHMVALGLTNVAIAGKLELSPWTVSTHLRRVFAKLDVSTRAAMVAVIAEHNSTVPAPPAAR